MPPATRPLPPDRPPPGDPLGGRSGGSITDRRRIGLPTNEDAALISPGVDLTRALHELAAPAYVTDREGRFRWLNLAYIELIGDLVGRPFIEVVAREDHKLARTNFARKVIGGASTFYDLRVVDRHGERLTLRVASSPLRRDEKIIGVFGIGLPLDRGAPGGDSFEREAPLARLTPRQLEVLRLLREGLETQEIAKRLGIADETARNHIRALLRAMDAHSRLEAVVMGLRIGLFDDPS